MTVEQKYQLASEILIGKPFNKGCCPYQDFANLIRLRNWLVHLTQEPPDVVRDFTTRKLGYPRPKFESDDGEIKEAIISPLSVIATSNVAAWACDAASGIVVSVLNMFPHGIADPMFTIKKTFPPYNSGAKIENPGKSSR